MTSRERVLAALRCEQPDRVPYCELAVDRALAQRLMGWGEPVSQAADLEKNPYTLAEAEQIAARLNLDNICYVLRAPVYAHKEPGLDGRLFYGAGMIRTEADLDKIELSDPHDERLYTDARYFAQNKGDYAAWFVTRLGIFPAMLSIGLEDFSFALFENRPFVEAVLDRYCDWAVAVAEHACQLGFDVFATTDDIAFTHAPFFSPKIFRELILPYFQRMSEKITLPWVIHSDGNLMPILDELVELGIAGLHPIEKVAMDIRIVKERYGGKICLLGNVDLNLLGMATPEEVEAEVAWLIQHVGIGGGYIVTSGNSLAGYLRPENVLALSNAVQKYGVYPLKEQ